MSALRALLIGKPRLVLVLLALVLAVKAVVPTGFMLAGGGDRFLTVTICADAGGAMRTMQIALPGKGDKAPDHTADNATPCGFAGLGHAMAGGADPLLLAGAIAFVLLLGLAPLRTLPLRKAPFLRPQLRGPPILSV